MDRSIHKGGEGNLKFKRTPTEEYSWHVRLRLTVREGLELVAGVAVIAILTILAILIPR